jgi:hypothetical protein
MAGESDELFELRALVGCPDVLQVAMGARTVIRMALLDQDLGVLPMSTSVCAAAFGAGDPLPPELGFRWLTPGGYRAIRQASRQGPIGYVEIHYTVASVWEAAGVWVDGVPVYGPDYLLPVRAHPLDEPTPVGEALRRLGVLTDDIPDEVAAIGLDRFRSTDDWFTMAAQTIP